MFLKPIDIGREKTVVGRHNYRRDIFVRRINVFVRIYTARANNIAADGIDSLMGLSFSSVVKAQRDVPIIIRDIYVFIYTNT